MRLTRHQLYLWAFFLMPLIYVLSLPIAVGDLAIWIAHGRWMLEHGELLRRDVFSFAATRDLVYPVLTCLGYAGLYAAGGLIWVSLAHKAIAVAVSAVWYWSALRKTKSPWSGVNVLLILLSWWGSAFICVERPNMLAALPFLAAYLVLQRDERFTWREVVFLNALNVVWVNLHGSWVILLGLMAWRVGVRAGVSALRVGRGSRATAARAPRTSLLELACLAALPVTSLLNPFGPRVFSYVLETARLSRERGMDEWAFTDLQIYFPQGLLFYVLLTLACAAAFAWFRTDRAKLLRLVCSPYPPLLIAGVLTVRNTVWPFLALLPLCAHLGVLRAHRESKAVAEKARVFNGVLVAVMIVITAAFLPQAKPYTRAFLPPNKRKVFYRFAPFAFGEYLSDPKHARGRIFNNWDYGSYLALEQPNPFFIDTRNVIYPDDVFDDYRTVISLAKGWQRVLAAYGAKYVLLEKPENDVLSKALRADGHWTVALEDDESILFARAPDSHLIRK